MIGQFSLSLLGLAQICSWGTLYYAFPQMAVAMTAELGWTKPEIYLALTIGLTFSALSSMPVGVAIDKGHGSAIMTGGSIIAGLLFIAWSQVNSLPIFYLIFSGIGVMQASTLYTAAFAVIAKHYDSSQMRSSITTLTLWGGFASTIFIPFIEFLMHYSDWRVVLVLLGMINIFVCGSIYQTLPKPLPAKAQDNKQAQVEDLKSKCDCVKWAALQPVFWTLLITFLFYAAMATAFKFHLYPLLIERGLSGEDAVFIFALLGPAQVAGRFIMKIMTSKSIAQIGLVVTAVFPLSLAAFTFLPTYMIVLIPATIAYGAASGTMTIIEGIAIPEFLTKESYGAINGMLNIPITLTKALAPSIAAFSWFITKDYNLLLIGLTVISFAMLMAFSLTALFNKTKGKCN